MSESGGLKSLVEKIDEIFDLASELPPEAQRLFLDVNCGSDQALRSEVERLLSSHTRSGILDGSLIPGVPPPTDVLPARTEPMLPAGIVLADRFRIVRLIGTGGMGEVYEARDLTSGMSVAIKTVRFVSAEDSGLIRRFRNELLLSRDVSHPNVCRVFEYWEVAPISDSGSDRPLTFFTMELLKGETLAERISTGRLGSRQALTILRQVAAGLTEVHRLGIVHRDLKPANIFLVPNPGGGERAVLMDFGLARATAGGRLAQTQTGLVMGTPPYMAPELFTGAAVTQAADVYSFGVTAFEMVTGANHPLMAPRSRAPELDPVWDKLLLQCFEREPRLRPKSVIAVVEMLERGSRKWYRAAVATGAALSCTALAALTWHRIDPSPVRAPEATQLTFDSGFTIDPAASADGKLLVYASDRGSKGDLNIWLQRLDTGETKQITDDPGDEDEPALSPDGKLVAYTSHRDNTIYVKPVSGGAARAVAKWSDDPRFSPDGRMLAYWTGHSLDLTTSSGQIWVAPITGGTPRRLAPEIREARFPTWSANGKSILFRGNRAAHLSGQDETEFWVADVPGGKVYATGASEKLRAAGLILHASPMIWYDSRVIFAAHTGHSTNLWALSINSILRKALGGPSALTTGSGLQQVPAILPDGRVAYASWREQVHLWKVDAARGALTQLTFQDSMDTRVSVSRDGNTVVFGRRLGENRNIWIRNLGTGVERQLAANELALPFLSPSGMTVAFSAGPSIRTLDVSTGKQTARCSDCGELLGWMPDESAVLYREASGSKAQNILLYNLVSGERRGLISSSEIREVSISPDMSAVAFSARQSGGLHSMVFTAPLDRGRAVGPWSPITPENEWADKPVWSDDSGTVYYHSDRDGFECLWSQKVVRKSFRAEGKARILHHFHAATFTLSHLGDVALGIGQAAGSVFLSVGTNQSNIWAVRN